MSLKQPPNGKYEVGDKVRYAGMDGVVVGLHPEHIYPVKCKFDSEEDSFSHTGKFIDNHPEPLLEFVSRPRRTVVRRMAPALYKTYIGTIGISTKLYQSEEEARLSCGGDIDLIKLLWDRAVEVETNVSEEGEE